MRATDQWEGNQPAFSCAATLPCQAYRIGMSPVHSVFYRIVCDYALQSLRAAVTAGGAALESRSVKMCVVHLLQASLNPLLALTQLPPSVGGIDSSVIDELVSDGLSRKVRAVVDHGRTLSRAGEKCVIWTLFSDTAAELERSMADLNPVSLFRSDAEEGSNGAPAVNQQSERFHDDPECSVLLANPARIVWRADLNKLLPHAIYLDRSYSAEDYVRSLETIFPRALSLGAEVRIHVYKSEMPVGVGSIDDSVDRRLVSKLCDAMSFGAEHCVDDRLSDGTNISTVTSHDPDRADVIDLCKELESSSESVDHIIESSAAS